MDDPITIFNLALTSFNIPIKKIIFMFIEFKILKIQL